jgi:signal transduction histidine kinase
MPDTKDRIASALVSSRTHLEEALYELEKLPAVSQDAVSFTAHALNNFLSVTGGTVDLLLLALADHPDPQIRIWLEGLRQAAEMMTHSVSQLMNASAGLGAARLRFEEVDLVKMVDRICGFYRRVADPKQIRILRGSTLDIPPVWADWVALAAVLDNLVSNAVKYSEPGKQLHVQITAEREGVVCSVRDEGPGLSPEDQARLFQRGARLTPRPTGGEPSTGYGLAVARELIEQLGGTIWCESTLGQGCCFSIRLPVSPKHLRQGEASGKAEEQATDEHG